MFFHSYRFNQYSSEATLTHSSILAWRIPGTEEPGGLPSMRSHRVGHNWSDLAAASGLQYVFFPWLIFLRIDWFDLLAVQQTCKSILQHHSSKALILWLSAFFMVQLSIHPYMTAAAAAKSLQLCLTLCYPMNYSTPGLSVHHQLPESTQTYVHWVDDAIQPSHPLSSPSPAPNLS